MISHSSETKRYCSEPLENIENYDKAVADTEHMWHCHHRLEVQGQFRNSKKLLKRCGMYYHRPASELMFLRHDVHGRLHCKGTYPSDETRSRMSASQTNRQDLSTSVEMTRISDGLTKVFPSQGEAARWLRENGFPKASQGYISCCCHGIRHSAYGARWRIVDE